MQRPNRTGTHIKVSLGSILLAMLFIVSTWAILTPGISDAFSQQTPVVDSTREKKARTISWSEGPVSLTEVWVETTQGTRRLGTFLGRSRGLEWNLTGDRLHYIEQPLETKMISIPLVERRVSPLFPPRIWEIPIGRGHIRTIPESSVSDAGAGRTNTNTADAHGPASKETRAALQALGAAFQTAAMAYTALHQWDFEGAAENYRRAASRFAALPRKFQGIGLYREPLDEYVKELKGRAIEARKHGARWVCRDHLRIIADLLRAFALDSDGSRPENLPVLKSWAAAQVSSKEDLEVLNALFRSPADPESEREFSYFYRPDASRGEAILTSFFYKGRLVELVHDPDGDRIQDRSIGRVQVDSLLSVGMALLEAENPLAPQALEMVTRVAPRFALGHAKAGYAYLESGQMDKALSSFERATRLDHRLAEAYNGLGLVFQERPKARHDAIRYFQKALQYDRDYVEARFNIAKIRYALKEYDVKSDSEKLLVMDPTFGPAHLLLGEWYETFQEDYERAALHYAQYMSLRPDDPQGRNRLAAVYLKSREYARIVELLEGYARQHPGDTEILPILAQACLKLDALDQADTYFKRYLESINVEERALFRDISLVASEAEMAAFEESPEAFKGAFLQRFWTEKEPDLTTAANERLLEHYRRVWYARRNFSGGRQPWDRRGDVYVRFGEPDHRSRSDMMNVEQSLAVQRVKERLARAIYGTSVPAKYFLRSDEDVDGIRHKAGDYKLPASPFESIYPGPVYPVQSLRQSLGEGPEFSAKLADSPESNTHASDARPPTNYRPVSSQEDASMVAWETWVYVDVGGGIEITFTDEFQNGIYDFAPSPSDARIPVRQQASLNRYNPRTVTAQATSAAPNYFRVQANTDPLTFYYDLADFRQEDGTAMEVYFGVPHVSGHFKEEKNETRIEVERTVALLNKETGAIYRRKGQVIFKNEGDLTGRRDGFVPDMVRVGLPAGSYLMEIGVKDLLSRKQGRYRQDVIVEAYGGQGLQISDLQLAWQIDKDHEKTVFSKGALRVIPMPTRSYGTGKSVFVYYEIYNLTRGEFGQTKYRVSYTIASEDTQGIAGTISSLFRWRAGKREELSVTYEQQGTEVQEAEYVELELENRPAGKYLLKVTVADVNSGETAEKDAGFVIAK